MQSASCAQCFGWISNGTSSAGAFLQYTWPSPVQIGSIYVDGPECTTGTCSGRTLSDATLQYWDGVTNNWVTITTFSGVNGDIAYSFPSAVTTDPLTRTRPAVMNASAFRREATPHRAR